MIVVHMAARRRLTGGDPGSRPGGALGRHFDGCLKCQAEAVRIRRMARSLRELRDLEVPAPPGLSERVMGSLDGSPDRPAKPVGRLATAVAAGTALVVAAALVVLRHRASGATA